MGNMQILCGNLIPQTSKQELCVALTVPDYINEKYNKYATREDALETDLLQDPVLCCFIPMLWDWPIKQFNSTRLWVQQKAIQDKSLKSTMCIGENRKDAFYTKIQKLL